MAGSSPVKVKITSRQISTNFSIEGAFRSDQPRTQKTLKATMRNEIGDQTFEFSSTELSRILSPKKPKPHIDASGKLLRIDDYDCDVDKEMFNRALDSIVKGKLIGPFVPTGGSREAFHYPSLATFLTKCIDICHAALDIETDFPRREKRWYNGLEFIVGRQAMDGTEDAAALKPDITGRLRKLEQRKAGELDSKATGSRRAKVQKEAQQESKGLEQPAAPGSEEAPRLHWNPPTGEPAREIVLPVEVKKDWRDLISQTATYARSMFYSRPNRMFAIALAYNHDKKELRFLVFHRGGLAASKPLHITTPSGLEDIVRLFLTLGLWTTAAEAGFVPCCNDTTYLLPADKDGGNRMALTVERILFRSLCVRGRMTHVFLLLLPTSTPPEGPQPGGKRRLEVDFELTSTFRGSERPSKKSRTSSNRVQDAAISGGSRSQDPPPPSEATTSTEPTPEKVAPTPESPEQKFDEWVGCPNIQLKYFKPSKITRADGDPTLEDMSKSKKTVVLKTSWPGLDRRHNEAEMYKDCNGRFGVMPHVCSYEVTGEYGEVISNILFFPEEDQIRAYHWPIFASTAPAECDIRTYNYSILGPNGKQFIYAENPFELSRAWACSLIGWLSVYLSGHLHRDPSLGNILLAPVEETKPFEIPEKFLTHVSSLQDEKAAKEIKELCEKVKKLVDKLDLPVESHAVIGDGDLAVPWETYWSKERRASKSGTPEFMSRALIAAEEEDNYLHSPVDDLEAFFWVAVWSVFFNQKSGESWKAESAVRQALLENEKDAAMGSFQLLTTKKNRNDVTRRFQTVIRRWWKVVQDRDTEWREEITYDPPDGAKDQYYLPHFHRFALQGVLDILGVLQEHWHKDISWKSWAAS